MKLKRDFDLISLGCEQTMKYAENSCCDRHLSWWIESSGFEFLPRGRWVVPVSCKQRFLSWIPDGGSEGGGGRSRRGSSHYPRWRCHTRAAPAAAWRSRRGRVRWRTSAPWSPRRPARSRRRRGPAAPAPSPGARGWRRASTPSGPPAEGGGGWRPDEYIATHTLVV